jgi:Na+-driven multidrug efflux pump
LIPLFGAIGAAIASVITEFTTNVIIGFIFKPIHRNNYLMIKALNPKITIDLCRSILRRYIKKYKNKQKYI